MTEYHTPALLKESLEGLNIQPDGIYVDVTFGGGGHSREILKRLTPKGKLVAFDQDRDARENIIGDDRFIFVQSNFRYLKNFLRYQNIEKVDGVLADLGVSSHHFDDSSRGFSFRFTGNLDMRMNQNSDKEASHIVNNYSLEDLSKIFSLYGELKNAKRIAQEIVARRNDAKIQTIEDFTSIIQPFIYKDKEKKMLAQLFQALRIEVNDEMGALTDLLRQSKEVLNQGGRLCVISYHSLEDRLVKNYFKTGNIEGEVNKDFFGNVLTPFEIISRKVIIPTEEELNLNPRSRSAKLRGAVKK